MDEISLLGPIALKYIKHNESYVQKHGSGTCGKNLGNNGVYFWEGGYFAFSKLKAYYSL